jgi:hypothetical protein
MEEGETKIKLFAIFVLIFLILISFSGCVNIKCSYIPDKYLDNGWYENLSLRNTGLHLLGLEKWCSSVYEIKGKYPATLTVTTLKTLFLEDESDLYSRLQSIIKENLKDRILVGESTNFTGERSLNNSHKSKFIIYDGIDKQKQNNIKIIGEVWNCGISGSSILCIGIAYITNNDNSTNLYTDNWQKIVRDPDGNIENHYGENGLIFNIICH